MFDMPAAAVRKENRKIKRSKRRKFPAFQFPARYLHADGGLEPGAAYFFKIRGGDGDDGSND